MRTIICLLTLAAASISAGCQVEPLEGCRSDDDCRFGRLCDDGVCVWPSDVDVPDQVGDTSPDGGPRPDVGPDVRPDRGGDAQPDRGPGPILVVSPDPIDFGVVPPGTGASVDVRVVNLGDAPATVAALRVRDGDFYAVDGFPDAGLTLAMGQSITVVVTAELPADVPRGTTLEDSLVIEAGRASPNPVPILAVADEGEVCLRSIGPTTLSMELGSVVDVEVRLENCGTVDIVFERLAIEAQGDGASLDVVSLPRGGSLIEPGESAPILANLSGDRVGRTAFVFLVDYSADGARRLEIPLTVLVGDSCSASPLLSADREGPTSDDGSLEIEFGHQISLLSVDGSIIEDATLEVIPPDSDPVLVGRDDGAGWLFVPDRPGLYGLRVVTVGVSGCAGEHEVEIAVLPPPGDFAAWVIWGREGAGWADLDLYLARETSEGYFWERRGDAVGPTNHQADFGDPGVFQDNPRYVFDYNAQGWGPEQIRIPSPNDAETLAIGVHAFSLPDGLATVEARVFVRLGGELLGPFEADFSAGQFWIVAEARGLELIEDYALIVDGFPEPGLP